jgi:hypothetical protein
MTAGSGAWLLAICLSRVAWAGLVAMASVLMLHRAPGAHVLQRARAGS